MFTLIALMATFGALLGVLGIVLDLTGAALSIGLDLAPLIFIIYLITKYVKKNKDRTKKENFSSRSNDEESRILANLKTYFKNDARLYFDDETYITPADPNNITFDTLDIYMRDEYISSLSDYKLAFPNAYNTFIDMVGDYVKKNKRVKKQETAAQKTPVSTPSPAKKQVNKDAEYYIEKLNELNNQIEVKTITDDLYETVLYLNQIKKIEDTFPACKEKTTKLYQYYLPMLVDILENYKRLSFNSELHKEFKENEDRLIKTLVLINGALKTLSQNLLDEYYTELSVDMKTLEALLKKDGLADDGLSLDKYLSDQQKGEVEANG